MGSPASHLPATPLRVAPATSNDAVLRGLRSAFGPAVAVVTLVDPATPQRADVVFLDTSGLTDSGVSTATDATRRSDRPLLVLADRRDERVLLRMLRAGVRGFVVRPREPRRLLADLVAVSAGEIVVDPEVAVPAALLAARMLDFGRSPAELLGLSGREVQVLTRLDSGASAREVGADLYVSHETIRSHLKRIYRKLGVHDRNSALARARQDGVIPHR